MHKLFSAATSFVVMSVAAVVLALTGPAGAQAGNPPMDPKLVAMLEKVRQMLPDYEKLCDESDKTIREMRSLATPLSANAVQALQEAQLRIEVIRSIRQLIARSPRTLAGPGGLSVDATTMLPVWKEGIVYYLDCAKAGKDPFQCATAGIRTVKSRMDGELLFYRFSVPNAYDKARKYPADIHLHCSKALVWRATWVDGKPSFDAKDANFGQNNQAVWPNEGFMFSASGRGEGQYQVIAEAAVMEIVADIKKNYSVDEDRIVSGGDSMGGLGGFRIGTLHPDQFAAVRSLSGSAVVPVNSYYSANLLLDNLCNIGMGLMDAGKDPNSKLTAVSIAEIKALQQKYPGCYPMHTVYDAEAVHGCVAAPLCQETYAWMRTQKRNLWPKTVIYKTYCLRYDGAYWAHIDMVDDPTKPARIEAQVQDGGKIRVVADNIQRLRLNLAKELVGDLKTVAVAIDGQEPLTVPAGGEIFFARDGGKWAISSERLPTGLAKSHGMSGPVADAFMENPVLWVYGASEGQDSKANQDIDKIVNYWFGPGEGYIAFHTDFERKADKDVTDADIADKNLILVGAPKQNALLARLADRLPVKFLDNGVEVGGKRYAEAGTSILMIYPNPLNPKRYILLMPAWLADSNGLSHGDYDNTLYQFGDYVVCKLGPTGENGTNVLTPIVQGSFDSRWQLPTSANRQATRQQTSPACTASILP